MGRAHCGSESAFRSHPIRLVHPGDQNLEKPLHPNVLKLYGASSATGNPPWFFVSPYMKHGNLPFSKSRGCFGMEILGF